MILGTVAYMSPEQARGETIDHRSDLFTLGVVLQEMLTGECPYLRGSAAETLGAILKETPPALDAGHIGAPPDLVSVVLHVLDKCLAKDRDERYQTTKDLTLDLKWIHRDSDSERPRPSEQTSPRRWALRGALRGRPADRGSVRPCVLAPRGACPSSRQPYSGHHGHREHGACPTWSPESRMLAYYLDPVDYSGNTDIWATQVGSGQPLESHR